MVSDAAYNLFYRRRGYLDLENIDYDKIKLEGDPSYAAGGTNGNNAKKWIINSINIHCYYSHF